MGKLSKILNPFIILQKKIQMLSDIGVGDLKNICHSLV